MTLEEFMQLPDQNIELIDGQVVNERTPTYGHQKISGNILIEISLQLRNNKTVELIPASLNVIFGKRVLEPICPLFRISYPV